MRENRKDGKILLMNNDVVTIAKKIKERRDWYLAQVVDALMSTRLLNKEKYLETGPH